MLLRMNIKKEDKEELVRKVSQSRTLKKRSGE
jgi:hypothetical protein